MTTKRCSKCGEIKSVSEFSVRSEISGYSSQCKECRREKYRNEDPELIWKRRLKWLYNISAEEYYMILESQDGHCALCPRTPEDEGIRLAVDHDHSCCPGKRSCGICVRGLLCVSCNRQLGQYENNMELFTKKIPAYIRGDI
jgi:hypothetical protein